MHLTSSPGRGRTGWYVKDCSIRDCTVTLGSAHLLRIQAQEVCDKLNRPIVLMLAQVASAKGDHAEAAKLFRSVGIDYIHRKAVN